MTTTLTLSVSDEQRAATAPLYVQYVGHCGPQRAYLEVDPVTGDCHYGTNYENTWMRARVMDRSIIEIAVPAMIRGDMLDALYARLRPEIESIVKVWTVGRRNIDAEMAVLTLDRTVMTLTSDAGWCARVVDTCEWLGSEQRAWSRGRRDAEIELMAGELESLAHAQRIVLRFPAIDVLREWRDAAAAEESAA